MLSHAFSHDDAHYEVSFQRADGQWFGALQRHGHPSRRALPLFAEEIVCAFSEDAIRAGYVALAEWIVRERSWPDPATDSPGRSEGPVPPRVIEKRPPQIGRTAQDQIGRELQAMYDGVLGALLSALK
jgi:hypothetical protein